MSLLAKSPFVNVEGLINPRDLNDGSLESMKRGLAYRSGSLEVVSSKGTQQLQALGIKKIIDLRSAEEISAFPDPAIAGIEVDAANINRKWNRNESDTGAGKVGGNVLAGLYVKMIETNPHTFRAVLLHVRDNPDAPFLFHCTGIYTMVTTCHVDGVSDEDHISRDFALTVSFEPFRDLLQKKLVGDKPVDMNDETVKWKLETFGSSKAEVMTAFLENIDEKYGTIEECVKVLFEFDDEEIQTIKANLAP